MLLYFWSVFWFSFAFVGGILYDALSPSGTTLVFIFICLAGLVILIPLLLYRKHFYLKWWGHLLLEICLFFIGILVLFVVFEVMRPVPPYTSLPYEHALGSVIAVYGLIAAFIAFW